MLVLSHFPDYDESSLTTATMSSTGLLHLLLTPSWDQGDQVLLLLDLVTLFCSVLPWVPYFSLFWDMLVCDLLSSFPSIHHIGNGQ